MSGRHVAAQDGRTTGAGQTPTEADTRPLATPTHLAPLGRGAQQVGVAQARRQPAQEGLHLDRHAVGAGDVLGGEHLRGEG